MSMTVEQLQEFVQTTAEFLNIRYFDGDLKFQIEVAKREVKRKYGWVLGMDRGNPLPRIFINPCLRFASVGEIEEIIVHEMLHILQLKIGQKLGHGKPFADLAKQFGIPRESGHRFTSAAVRTPRQMRAGIKAKK